MHQAQLASQNISYRKEFNKLDYFLVIIWIQATDDIHMDFSFDLAIMLLQFVSAAGVILLGLKFMKKQQIESAKSKILQMQARLSKARMTLKGKVQRKAIIFRSTFKTPIFAGDQFDTALKRLNDNNFDTGADFQNYFDTSRQIVSLIHADPKSRPNAGDNPTVLENDFMSKELKTEMDIIRIIKEISDVSAKLNERIDGFNFKFPSHAIEKVDPIYFTSMADVNRVFKSDSGSSSSKKAA